jgi:hypothetical protein
MFVVLFLRGKNCKNNPGNMIASITKKKFEKEKEKEKRSDVATTLKVYILARSFTHQGSHCRERKRM